MNSIRMILQNKIVEFYETKCIISIRQYDNKRIAIELLALKDKTPFAVASVNLPDFEIEKNMVFIKDYSENDGMLRTLVEADIVKDTGETAPSGFVDVPLCILNEKIYKEYLNHNSLFNQIINN